MVEGIGLPIFP